MLGKSGVANNSLFACFFAGFLGGLAALLITFLIVYHFFDFHFIENASCGEGKALAYCFFDKQWNSSTYLSIITSFYSIVIAMLIGLLGAVAAFAFLSIRTSALRQAEGDIEKQVDIYFEQTKAEEKIQKGLKQLGNVEIEKLGNRLEAIEIALEEAGLLPEETLGTKDEKTTG